MTYKSPKILLRDTKVYDEHIRVTCYKKNTQKIKYRYYHSLTIEKSAVEERCKAAARTGKVNDFNVILFGTDSLSRLNAIRNLDKTRQFLLNNLNATEYFGYNKVADNTFPNMVPLLTGAYACYSPGLEVDWGSKDIPLVLYFGTGTA